MTGGDAGPNGADATQQRGGTRRNDVGGAEAGILLAILLIFFVLTLIFLATGDGFCFEYC